MMTEFDFVKTIYSWGFPIDCYVQYNWITKDQYNEITGKDASTSTSAGASESTSTDASQA
ncbi:XkdX family protein [Limosilactobacillus mucosae]|uniref:XkdX family protein n=1 Tax=Limosilactobacillus mucosae TaxID=97478 RepID=UPI00053C3619|nr:XkdX family protein [Limosilactobacillus mucosae]